MTDYVDKHLIIISYTIAFYSITIMTPSTAMATSTPAVSEQTATLKRNSEVTEATPSSSASHGMFIDWRNTQSYKSQILMTKKGQKSAA